MNELITINTLTEEDIHKVIAALPGEVKQLLKTENIYLAGGAILSILTDKEVCDYDFFGPDAEKLREIAYRTLTHQFSVFETKNAVTLKPYKNTNAFNTQIPPLQFITRWEYKTPYDCMMSFDFTVCRVALYYDKNELDGNPWKTVIGENFYEHLNQRLLIYTKPVRDEDSCGSLLRSFKYAAKGFKVPKESICGVMARFIKDVYSDDSVDSDETVVYQHLHNKIASQTNIQRENY